MLKLRLQLFATQTTETPGLSAEMKTFYEKRLIDLAEPKLVHGRFGDSYPIPQGSGKQIEFRKYSILGKALTPLTEGVTPAGNSLTVTTITCPLKQYGDWIQMSDMLQLTAVDNNIVQATKLLGSQAGRTLDTVIREELCGGTNVIYAPKQANGQATEVTSRTQLDKTAVLTPELFFKAAAQLSAMNADYIDDSYVAIIHPYAAYDLMRNSEWIDVHKYADPKAIYDGEIGKLGSVRFVSSTEAKIWKDDTCPLRAGGVRHAGAGRPRLWRHHDRGRRAGAHRQAAGLRGGSAEPAQRLRLEGHQGGQAPGGGVHGAHRELLQLLQRSGGELRQRGERRSGRGASPPSGKSVKEGHPWRRW